MQDSSTHISPLTQPIPTHLHTRILAGEYVDFNSLLAYAMFSVSDGSSSSHTTDFHHANVPPKW